MIQFTVRDVEQRAGLNFLTRIPGQKEDKVETVVVPVWAYDAKKWRQDQRERCKSS